MKPISKADKLSEREKILRSVLASFRIEGIEIPLSVGERILKKVELKLGKPKK